MRVGRRTRLRIGSTVINDRSATRKLLPCGMKKQQQVRNERRMREAVQQATSTVDNTVEIRTHSRELMARSAALLAKSNALSVSYSDENMVAFLKTDLKVGLTFARIARQKPDNPERQQNQKNARIAYDTVLRFLERMRLSDANEAEIQSRAAELKGLLKKLGESV